MEQLARIILALLALTLLLQLIQRGPGGAVGWLKAKFLGDTSAVPPVKGGTITRPAHAPGANGQLRPT